MAHVKNISQAVQGVSTAKGRIFLQPGEEKHLNLDEDQVARVNKLAEHGLLSIRGRAINDDQTPVTEIPVPGPAIDPDATLEARHKGGKTWAVFRGEVELSGGISKEEAADFNALPDADKEAMLGAFPPKQ